MERMGNACIQAAREVRSQTELSDGTVSASFAAIKLLKQRKLPAGTPVLLIGLGSFGTGLARNIRTYLPHVDLVLCNRTDEKAQVLSQEIFTRAIPFSEVVRSAANYRVVITTISGRPGAPLIPHTTWNAGSPILALDLSVPRAMEIPPAPVPGQEFLSIDAVSDVIRSTLSYRESFLPQAREMLIRHLEDFLHWSRVYEQRDLIRDVKRELLASSHRCPFWQQLAHTEHEKLIQDVVADYVKFLKGAPDQDRSRAGWIQSWMDLVHRQLITLEDAPAEGQGHTPQVSAV
jgi:glutamyl-tRNA reductase